MIGLTGGYAAGKSVVSSMLTELGAEVIDCDALAREVVAPGSEGLAQVADKFGREMLNEDGSLNRAALGEIVFRDEEKRRSLEKILHPLIIGLALKKAGEILAADPKAVVVVEAALLFESGLYKKMDANITVTCSPAQQVERGMSRDGLTREAAKLRAGAQLPMEKKEEMADWVIDNSGDMGNARRQAEVVWKQISDKL